MRLTCPCCGAAHSLDVLLADQSAREAVIAALTLPSQLGERLLRYLSLFRPRERALSWERAARLLGELNAIVATGQIERDGRVYPAPLDYWRLAIDQMLDQRERLKLPLKTHGYLFEIIVGLSQKAEDRQAAKQEIDNERAKAREGDRTGQMQAAGALAQALTPNPSPSRGEGEREAREEGETPAEPRPARTPPPPEFKALLAKLKSRMTPNGDVVDGSVT